MVVEEHMVCATFNRMYCATYWFNPNILLHEKHYKVDGVAMGSPLAPILANLFLGFHEETWLNNFKKADISYWVTNSHVDSVTPYLLWYYFIM